MRITIEIDGNEVLVTTSPPLVATAMAHAVPPTTASIERLKPPPELLRAAAALGAADAGPAPAEIATTVPMAIRGALVEGPGSTDAGAAPRKTPVGRRQRKS